MELRTCVLASGSSGNATLVSDGNTHVLIDCGLVAKEIVRRLATLNLSCEQLSAIVITHAHTDHFKSAGTIHARYGVPVYIDPQADQAIRLRASNGSYSRIAKTNPLPSSIGKIKVKPFATTHTVWGGRPCGFILGKKGSKVGIVTDTGDTTREMINALRTCQTLIVEANYDPKTLTRKLRDADYSMDWPYLEWVASNQGHLSNQQCAELLAATVTTNTKHIFLAHLSENHRDPSRDNNTFDLALATLREFFQREHFHLPQIHRTYRRDATEGQVSDLVSTTPV